MDSSPKNECVIVIDMVLYRYVRYNQRAERFAADADVFSQHVNPFCLWKTADLQNHGT